MSIFYFYMRRLCIGLPFLMISLCTYAFEPFQIKEIRVQGTDRIEAETVLGYLPIHLGDSMTDAKASDVIKTLFATGFFEDVRLDKQGDNLLVLLKERPVIASIEISGSTSFDTKALIKVLNEQGLGEARIFDKSILSGALAELKKQYTLRGKSSVKITETITPLLRNRIGISLLIEEGDAQRIKSIQFSGNQVFSSKQLLDQMQLTTTSFLARYTKTDQYVQEKFDADLSALKRFYKNHGYWDFSIESTRVSEEKGGKHLELSIFLREGEQYKVSEINISGELLGHRKELLAMIALQTQEVFSEKKLQDSKKNILDYFQSLGYAFAQVNVVPQVDTENRAITFNFFVALNKRVYVRRINITGNTVTRDEVIRRELLQYESAWYDAKRIRLSRDRLNRLGFFSQVEITAVPIPKVIDQVDLQVSVVERDSGNISLGVGLSTTDSVFLSGAITKQNLLGTGKSLSVVLNTSQLSRTVGLSYLEPYYMLSGIGRQTNLYYRTFNAAELDLGDYKTVHSGVGVRFSIPYTEYDRFFIGTNWESTRVELGSNAPMRFVHFVDEFGEQSYSLLGSLGWSRDSRNSVLNPTVGHLQSAFVDTTLPVLGDLRYWRATYLNQLYVPLGEYFTLAFNLDLGLGGGLLGKPFPVFKNFYAGGIGSVRGFYPSSLGPKDTQINQNRDQIIVSMGGQARILASVEFIFPIPGIRPDQSIRSFVFLDTGNVFPSINEIDLNELRYSAGIGLNWDSPVGPLKISLGAPIKVRAEDRVQWFQFQIGTSF